MLRVRADSKQAELPLEVGGRFGTPQEERDRIEKSFVVLDIPAPIQLEILEALDSDRWSWYEDCDGCTAVSETYWPNKFYPPCVRHDYDFLTTADGMKANARFFRIQRAYGMTVARAAVRFIGVTAAWVAWFKWRNMLRKEKTK